MANDIERILCAAIWYSNWPVKDSHGPINIDKGIVICGPRHHNVISVYKLLTGKCTNGDDIQGFMTTHRRFVDRIEAAKIAIRCEQISKLECPPELYSEDLY